MAQTGSAQREPSMEEILASIRRIIEDSDTARQPLPGDELEEQMSPPSSEPVVEKAEQEEVDAFRAELDEPVPQASPAPMSMADIQASVMRVQPPIDDEPVAPETDELAPADPAAAELDDEPLDFAPEPDLETAHDTQPKPVQAAVFAPEIRPAILSDQTSRQVAAAFGELSEAFAASRKRSFDEVAEDMLRPMLQDWLDNNLPTLVERLVREEIERVARGTA